MKTKLLVLVLSILATVVMATPASAVVSDFPSSIQWRKEQPKVSLETLQGKMVIVLFFQSWCPKCNVWSPELIKQMNNQYGEDMEVVLVALKTDSSKMSDAESYLTKCGADLDRWIVGLDPDGSYLKTFGFKGTLFKSFVVKPDGQLAEKIDAGVYYPQGNKKNFALARSELKAEHGGGATRIIPTDLTYDPKLMPVVRAFELGDLGLGMGYLKRVPSSLEEDAGKIEAAMLSHVEAKLPTLQAAVEDAEAADRYPAYKELQLIAKQLRRTEIGDAADAIVKAHRRDDGLREEEKAERAFNSMMQKASKLKANERAQQLKPALQKFAKAYEGTYYGHKAQAMAEGK